MAERQVQIIKGESATTIRAPHPTQPKVAVVILETLRPEKRSLTPAVDTEGKRIAPNYESATGEGGLIVSKDAALVLVRTHGVASSIDADYSIPPVNDLHRVGPRETRQEQTKSAGKAPIGY